MTREQIADVLDDAGWLYDHGMIATIETLIREAVEAERKGCANTYLMMAGNAVSIDDEAHLRLAAEAIRARWEVGQ